MSRAAKFDYSLHRTTFDDALAQGLYQRICLTARKPWTPEAEAVWRKETLEAYGDAAEEELFCVPSRSGSRYFPAALLDRASDPEARVARYECPDSFTFESQARREEAVNRWLRSEVRDTLLLHTGPVYLGEDFARSGDLTCVFLDEALPDGRLLTFLALELRNMPFDQQRQVIFSLMNTLPNFSGAAFDARGNGQMIAELAAQEWPGYVEQVMLSVKWYGENFPKLKERLEDASTNIPDDPAIREDFRAVGLKQGVPCVMERTGEARSRRHGDAAIAKVMALHAALLDEGKGYQPMTYEAVRTPNRYRNIRSNRWDD